MSANPLTMECSKCKVANYCPRKGSSPSFTRAKKKVLCVIVGGYGRKPLDEAALSEESKKLVEKNGPCLTIAEVPTFEDDLLVMELTKIFSPPILHEREKVDDVMSRIYPKAYKPE